MIWFLCSICNHLSNNRFNSLSHIARNHKKEISSDTAALSNMVAADCGKLFCRKLYGSHKEGKTFWCRECTRFFSSNQKVNPETDILYFQSYPYLKFDHDKDMFQCSICNHLSIKRS